MNDVAYLAAALAKMARLREDQSPDARRELALMEALIAHVQPPSSALPTVEETDPCNYFYEEG